MASIHTNINMNTFVDTNTDLSNDIIIVEANVDTNPVGISMSLFSCY